MEATPRRAGGICRRRKKLQTLGWDAPEEEDEESAPSGKSEK
jgi:hypothetical protein